MLLLNIVLGIILLFVIIYLISDEELYGIAFISYSVALTYMFLKINYVHMLYIQCALLMICFALYLILINPRYRFKKNVSKESMDYISDIEYRI